MTREILLTLDIGTTSCKAVAFGVSGQVVASAHRSYPTACPQPGWYEQDPHDWITAARETLRRVANSLGRRVHEVSGIALSAWGPSLVFLDSEGRPTVSRAPTWQDSRSDAHGRRLLAAVGPEWIGGGMPTTGFPAKLAWALENTPAIAQEATYAAGVKEVVLAWLTGVIATDPSSGPYGQSWHDRVLAELGWSTDRLPQVLPPTTIAGGLTDRRSEETGLPVGLPVVIGMNDGACATLGSGAFGPGDTIVSLGTNGVMRTVVDARPDAEPCLSHGLFRYPLVEGRWLTGGFVLAGGEALSWLLRAVSRRPSVRLRERLVAEAATVAPGSDGLLFLPYLVGRGSPVPNPAARAVFTGLDLHHTRAHMARAVMEGVCYGLKEIALALEELGSPPRRVTVTGGGAANLVWRRCLAGILARPVSYAEGSSNLGAAVLLARSLGHYPSISGAIEGLVANVSTTDPEPRDEDLYLHGFAAFRRVEERLVDSLGVGGGE